MPSMYLPQAADFFEHVVQSLLGVDFEAQNVAAAGRGGLHYQGCAKFAVTYLDRLDLTGRQVGEEGVGGGGEGAGRQEGWGRGEGEAS